jgi:hypothetical protein
MEFGIRIWRSDGACRNRSEIFERVVQFFSGMSTHSNTQRAKWIYIEFFVGSITYCSAKLFF